MKRSQTAVVDIRSADLTVLIGERGVNSTFVVRGVDSRPYLGYQKGVFLDERELKNLLRSLVKKTVASAGEPVEKFTVGVPSEFLLVKERFAYLAYPKEKKITPRLMQELIESVKEEDSSYYSPIVKCAADFGLTSGVILKDPVGKTSTSLSARIEYTYASNYFMQIVENAISPNGEFEVDFIPEPLAQSVFLLPREKRDGRTLFIDFGIYDSNLSLTNEYALVALSSMPKGEALVLKRLSELYGTDDEDFLYELLARTNLFYLESEGKRTKLMPVRGRDDVFYYDVNEVIYTVIDEIVEEIYSFVQGVKEKTPNGIRSIVIGGEGLPEIKGFREYLSRYLQIAVTEAKPPMPYYDKTEIGLSAYALLDMAIDKSEKNYNSNLLFKFLKKFGG